MKYKAVGFVIEVNGRTTSVESNSVYEKIYGYTKAGGELYEPAEAFGTLEASYFMAFKLNGIPRSAYAEEIKVTPRWTTLDGTIVSGTTRTIVINQVAERPDPNVWYGFDSAESAQIWTGAGANPFWLKNYDGENGVFKLELDASQGGNIKYVGNTGGVNWPAMCSEAADYQGAIGLVFRVKIEGDASNALEVYNPGETKCFGKVFDSQQATDGWQEFVLKVNAEENYDDLNGMHFVFWTSGQSNIYIDEIRVIYYEEKWYGFDNDGCLNTWGYGSAQRTWLESYEEAQGVMKIDLKYPDEGNLKWVGNAGGINWPAAGSKASDYHGAMGLAFRVKIEGSASNALTILGAEGQEMGKVFDGQSATDGWQEFIFYVDVEKEYENLNKMSWIFWVNDNSTIYLDEIRPVYPQEKWNSFDNADCVNMWGYAGAQRTWLESYEGARGVMKVDLKYPYVGEENMKYVGVTGGLNWPAAGSKALWGWHSA